MGFPLLALALGATALGTGGSMFFNNRAQSQVDRARREAIELERIRQREIERQSQQAQLESELPFQEAEERQAQAETDYLRDLRPTAVSTGIPLPNIAPSTPGIVAGAAASEAGRRGAFSNQQAEALAGLRGFSQYLFDANRERLRPAERLAQLAGNAQRSADVNRLELQAANEAGDTSRGIADLFGMVRDLGMAGFGAQGGIGALFQGTPAIVGGGSSLGGQGAFSLMKSGGLRPLEGNAFANLLRPGPRAAPMIPAPSL